MSSNPFRPAEQVAPKVKCLVYGASGIGKTYLALTAPGRIAVIDTEGGTAFYPDRVGKGGLHQFDVLPTKTFAQVESALEFLRTSDHEYESLVIDPVTVLYETLQEAAQVRRQDANKRRGRGDTEDADLEQLDWQRIKRSYKRLMTDLVNLNLHVFVVAREREVSQERNGRQVVIGYRPDAEKSTSYYFDTVLRMVPAAKNGREVIVEKDRTGTLNLGAVVTAPTFAKLFSRALKSDGTATRDLQSGEDAAAIDAATTMAAAELEDKEELLTPLGEITRSGVVARGQGRRSDLEARRMPNGWHIGFRLEVGDGKAIPQVVAEGLLGAELYHAIDTDTSSIYGDRVTVAGMLYEVKPAGRRAFHRLVLTHIAGEDWAVPATVDPLGGTLPGEPPAGVEDQPEAAPSEAESLPMLPLDDAERAAVGAGLPE